MKITRLFFLFLFSIVLYSCLILSCNSDEDPGGINMEMEEEEEEEMEINSIALTVDFNLNPTGHAPLSAIMSVQSEDAFNVVVTVKGRHGANSDHTIINTEDLTTHIIDVHGLYADYDNNIEIVAKDESGNILATKTQTISTDPLISDMPVVESQLQNLQEDHAVFYLVNYFGFDQEFVPQRPFLVDQFGDIRWYLDFSGHSMLDGIYLDNGLFHMKNNNIVFSGAGWDQVFITNLFGSIQNSFRLVDHTFHHTVIEKEDGNLLLTANQKNRPTVQDVILEINAFNGIVVNVWDLTESLDQTRTTWISNDNDWIHVNGVTHDPNDNTIIITGRTQGVFKLNYDNEIQWILAPHRGWGTSGNGVDMNQFLLQPLDQNGYPITDQNVIDGNTNTDDFEWNWYQHSPILLPNGNFMCFDNGDNRNFGNAPSYSRAVEYKIDQENMTVQQIWDYGKELGTEAYSRIVSKVTYLPELDHVTFTPGAINNNGPTHGRIYELDKTSKEILLDIKITPPNTFAGITFHNAQRFEF